MIRGIYFSKAAVAGIITFSLFLSRAMYKFYPSSAILQLMNDPLVAFILFIAAGIIILYPWMKGYKAVVLSSAMVAFVSFFIYAYYIV